MDLRGVTQNSVPLEDLWRSTSRHASYGVYLTQICPISVSWQRTFPSARNQDHPRSRPRIPLSHKERRPRNGTELPVARPAETNSRLHMYAYRSSGLQWRVAAYARNPWSRTEIILIEPSCWGDPNGSDVFTVIAECSSLPLLIMVVLCCQKGHRWSTGHWTCVVPTNGITAQE